MDIENSENKKFNSAVLEGVQIMCQMFWGPDLESCRHMMEDNFFQSFEIILEKPEKSKSEESKAEKRKAKEKSSIILDNINSINNINSIITGFDSHQSLFNHLNECYVRLFVNSREGIITPLYQSCYEFENAPMMGKSAIKMKNRFLSKGLSMENLVHEPPDHLAIELEYLFFLLQETGLDLDDDPDQFISHEAASFAAETMLPWVIVFNDRLKSVDEDCRFYFLASGILALLLGLISKK